MLLLSQTVNHPVNLAEDAVMLIRNMFKICVNDVKILSNKFETDFELDQVMNMKAMLKICFKCVQFRFEHVLNRI